MASCTSENKKKEESIVENNSIRVITLSPHLAEMLFNLGALNTLVGVSAYTDFPEQLKNLPNIGDAFVLDIEKITILEPDIILAWKSGTPQNIVDELVNLGFNVKIIKSQNLEDIASSILLLGDVVGKKNEAKKIANEFKTGIKYLKDTFQQKKKLRVFFQIDKKPIFTIGGSHFISEIIDICGGINIFSDVKQTAPSISEESVVSRDPEIIFSRDAASNKMKLKIWEKFDNMSAIKLDNLFYLNARELERPTSGLVNAGKEICFKLDQARSNYNIHTDS
jgi:iron complex transport system substrate-binding protein